MTTDNIHLDNDKTIIRRPKSLDELNEGDLVVVGFPMFQKKCSLNSLKVYSGQKDEKFEFIDYVDGNRKNPFNILGYSVKKDDLKIDDEEVIKFGLAEMMIYHWEYINEIDRAPIEYQNRFRMLNEAGMSRVDFL